MPSVSDRAPSRGHVGRELQRKEDPKLITGQARYVDDISLPGTLGTRPDGGPQS